MLNKIEVDLGGCICSFGILLHLVVVGGFNWMLYPNLYPLCAYSQVRNRVVLGGTGKSPDGGPSLREKEKWRQQRLELEQRWRRRRLGREKEKGRERQNRRSK